MKITADVRIPLVKELWGSSMEVEQLPNEAICQKSLKNTDVLLVRSVTAVNQSLLQNTPVRFVGSVTAGFNHLDTSWLDSQRIEWRYAAGCNAYAVCEYVLACINTLIKKGKLADGKLRVGVIGAGHIGSLVIQAIQSMGFEVFYYDPFKPTVSPYLKSHDLNEFCDLDVLTIHTPLTKSNEHSTYHLIDDVFLRRQKPHCALINTSRGEVVDESALLKNTSLTLCLDVWENEPDISMELLKRCFIATPHIAGYSEESKLRATLLVYQQMTELYDLPSINNVEDKLQQFLLPLQSNESYDPLKDTEYFKNHMLINSLDSVSTRFKNSRNHYILRRESKK